MTKHTQPAPAAPTAPQPAADKPKTFQFTDWAAL